MLVGEPWQAAYRGVMPGDYLDRSARLGALDNRQERPSFESFKRHAPGVLEGHHIVYLPFALAAAHPGRVAGSGLHGASRSPSRIVGEGASRHKIVVAAEE